MPVQCGLQMVPLYGVLGHIPHVSIACPYNGLRESKLLVGSGPTLLTGQPWLWQCTVSQ